MDEKLDTFTRQKVIQGKVIPVTRPTKIQGNLVKPVHSNTQRQALADITNNSIFTNRKQSAKLKECTNFNSCQTFNTQIIQKNPFSKTTQHAFVQNPVNSRETILKGHNSIEKVNNLCL